MARGQQKIESQQRNQEKKAAAAKAGAPNQKLTAQKAMVASCPVCKIQVMALATLKEHYEAKHPKLPLPAELLAGAQSA